MRLFDFLYSISVWFLLKIAKVAGVFSSKINTFFQLRNHTTSPPNGKVKYWFHCSSLGEYEMAVPLIEKILASYSLDNILITFFSPSGYNQAIKGKLSERIMYSPLDTQSAVIEFYTTYNPQKAVFIRYDFWYNLIRIGLKNNTKFYLVNGRFTDHHFIFKWYGKPYLQLLQKFSKIFTSDIKSSQALNTYNTQAEFTGDTRYDRVAEIVAAAPTYSDIEQFKGNKKLLILGSSWIEEEALALRLLDDQPDNLSIVIAPHDISRSKSILEQFSEYKPSLYTNGFIDTNSQILILNTIGMLSGVYRYADFVLVGGGFNGALHNILEPAVWGCYLSFGPNTSKFPEAQDFVNKGFADYITSFEQWRTKLFSLLDDESQIKLITQKSKEYCKSQTGATTRIIDNIC